MSRKFLKQKILSGRIPRVKNLVKKKLLESKVRQEKFLEQQFCREKFLERKFVTKILETKKIVEKFLDLGRKIFWSQNVVEKKS